MKKSRSTNQERIDVQLSIEDISQKQYFRAAEHQVFDNRIRNGEAVQAYAFRPESANKYHVGNILRTGRRDARTAGTEGTR